MFWINRKNCPIAGSYSCDNSALCCSACGRFEPDPLRATCNDSDLASQTGAAKGLDRNALRAESGINGSLLRECFYFLGTLKIGAE